MDTKNIGEEAEALVRRIDDDLTTPHDGECLVCFLSRMVAEFGCDGTHRFARRFRDLRVPRATGLEMRLARKGGYCDCEVLFNAYEPARHLWTPEHTILDEDGEEVLVEAEEPQLIPACAGIPRGSAQPCRNWEAQRR
ncbi:hypothetical protein GCM10022219_18350 [Microbacterium oryzae]|uniref:DUF2695 domain-containing protein n=1 Tax=Microbacterium oryzae TaxID=743009 RepID=A0A6I6DUU4_9MICO|nr:DUF2695 domain-containing protein [Microbacterium oryzae]QGU27876.1 DUF2695 domain-containing protein [Microbacterium oryzae]